jgi:hypothetical protein
MEQAELLTVIKQCRKVLKHNRRGTYTMPATELYPHQWLWDSCFIAIGLRHINVAQAMEEIRSLFRGQWSNGMLPNIIFSDEPAYETDRRVWFSRISPYAPDRVSTSGITQPPLVAEAVYKIGELLPLTERRTWYKECLPYVIRYHQWLYDERDPHGEGLVLQIHPYETGLDNTPPWIVQLSEHHQPWWVRAVKLLKLETPINLIRRDTRSVPANQRMTNMEALMYWDVIRRLKRKHYEINKILHRSLFCIEDLTYNSIFYRANTLLVEMAGLAGQALDDTLLERINRSKQAIRDLWDEADSTFYSRDFITHDLIKVPSIAALMPLYSGAITKEKAHALVAQLTDHKQFWLNYPVPSVPMHSSQFNPINYWQGPVWINTNWLIIEGLRRYGYESEANAIRTKSLALVAANGAYEYFSPIDGAALGSPNFSWTAALTLDLIDQQSTKK